MRRKQTKIVATISDLNCSTEFIQQLYENGMDVARLNTAHQDVESTRQVVENIRKVSDTIGILLDTKGPEVRTTGVDAPVELKNGQKIKVRAAKEITSPECIYMNYVGFVKDIPVGTQILIDDGALELVVVEKSADFLECEVVAGGILKSKKTVNVPSVPLNLPALSERDLSYVQFAIDEKLDFIAHSFVRNKDDVLAVQKLLDAANVDVKIIAKIENRAGVENIDEILDHAYGIMVARGDLAVEIPAEEVPLIQKRIIQKCMERARPVITATQMLNSMIDNPRPTRAEVSDVANAVLDGTDALMLSGESAFGKYPIHAMKMMARIARHVEREKAAFSDLPILSTKNKISSFFAKMAVVAAVDFDTKAIVIATHSGHTARVVAAYRGKNPIFAQCYSGEVARWLSLTYGVIPSVITPVATTDELVSIALNSLLDQQRLSQEDLVVIIGSSAKRQRAGSTFVEINTVARALEDTQ